MCSGRWPKYIDDNSGWSAAGYLKVGHYLEKKSRDRYSLPRKKYRVEYSNT